MEQFNFKRAKINIPRKNKKNKKIQRYIKKIKINESESLITQYNSDSEKSEKLITQYNYNTELKINKKLQNSELELINMFWNNCNINKSISLADKLKQQEEFRIKNAEWIKFYNSK